MMVGSDVAWRVRLSEELAAIRRRGVARSMRDHAWSFGALTAAGLLFAVSATNLAGDQVRRDANNLPDLVRDESGQVEALQTQAAMLEREIDVLTNEVGDSRVQSLQRQSSQLAPAAQTGQLRGPGVMVSLTDASSESIVPLGVDPNQLVVHSQDVHGVLNALWAGGADGVMVMDRRISNTSSVRCVGNILQLDGRRYSPPFTMTALGNPDRLIASLDNDPSVQAYQFAARNYGLGYSVERFDDRTLPAFTGVTEFSIAQPLMSEGTL